MTCYEFYSFRDNGILQDSLGPTAASGNSDTPKFQRYLGILKVEAKSVSEKIYVFELRDAAVGPRFYSVQCVSSEPAFITIY